MSPDRIRTWQSILDLSQQMLVQAEAGDWSLLAELGAQRRQALEAFFSEPQTIAGTSHLREGIYRILKKDERIMSLAQAEREHSVNRLSQLSNGRRAHAAYTALR